MYPSTLLKSYHKHSPFNFSPILYLKHYPLHLVHSHPSSIPTPNFITLYSPFLCPNSIISSFLLFIHSTTTSTLNSPLSLIHSHSLFLKTHHCSPQKIFLPLFHSNTSFIYIESHLAFIFLQPMQLAIRSLQLLPSINPLFPLFLIPSHSPSRLFFFTILFQISKANRVYCCKERTIQKNTFWYAPLLSPSLFFF